jgi:hypothetical protein
MKNPTTLLVVKTRHWSVLNDKLYIEKMGQKKEKVRWC